MIKSLQSHSVFRQLPKKKISICEDFTDGESFLKLGKSSCQVSIDYDVKDAKLSFDVTQISLLQKDKKYDVIIKRTGYSSGQASPKLQQQLVPQIHFMTNPMQFCFLVASLSKNRDRNGLEPLLNW